MNRKTKSDKTLSFLAIHYRQKASKSFAQHTKYSTYYNIQPYADKKRHTKGGEMIGEYCVSLWSRCDAQRKSVWKKKKKATERAYACICNKH